MSFLATKRAFLLLSVVSLPIVIGSCVSSRPAADAAPAANPASAPEPPTAEELDKEGKRSQLKKLGGLLAPIAVLIAKGKVLLLALAKIKAVSTLGTMFVSIAAYALAFGWPFAVGFVLLLLIHEMGHVIQLRREGVEASAPIFIPLLGGPEHYRFKNRHSEQSREYHSVPKRTKVAVAAIYLSLTAILVAAVAETYVARTL